MIANVRQIIGWLTSRWQATRPTARRIGLAAGGLALLGILWLAAGGRDSRVALDVVGLNPAELSAAARTLADRGISSKIVSGQLVVSARHAAAAREVLSRSSKRTPDAAEALAALAREDDLWRTTAQSDKRWQAAKMNVLSRLVETFPTVASATVLYEPGSPRGLGGAAGEPTAAVKVTMKEGAVLVRSLAAAIADLVAGSIAGLNPRQVRIVDGSGRSYRFDAEADAADKEFQHRRAAETYYHEKVHAAIRTVGNVVIDVSAPAKAEASGAMAVCIAVPRSYLMTVAQAERNDPSAADKALERIRQSALAAISDRPCQVKVDWYYDAAPGAVWQAAAGDDAGSGLLSWVGLWLVAILSAGVGAGVVLAAWRPGWLGLSGKGREQNASAGATTAESAAAEQGAPQRGLWGFLDDLGPQEIVSLVASEHPQTIAIVLSRLEPAKAAAVLAALGERVQGAVGRRLAMLHQVDPVVIAEVGRSLADRAADLAKAGSQGAAPEGRVAEVLRHAGYATEKVVLEALAGQAPALAEAVRRRMASFEDIAQMPPDRLWPALEAVQTPELAVALRTAGEDVRTRVFSAMPAQAARRVRKEMERMGPVRLTDVEAAQQHVIDVVRRGESGQYASDTTRQERPLLA